MSDMHDSYPIVEDSTPDELPLMPPELKMVVDTSTVLEQAEGETRGGRFVPRLRRFGMFVLDILQDQGSHQQPPSPDLPPYL